MRQVLFLTDLHVTPPGELIIGLDPGARLARVLLRMQAHHADADHLVVMGDLAHFGTAEEYARLRELMRDLPWPVTYMLGNHDDRATFQAVFPKAPRDAAGFVQSVIKLPEVHVICLDSLEPEAKPRHSGTLCPDRLTWLRAALAEAPGVPKVVCIHHPPFETGFSGMDKIGLSNRDAVLEVIASAPEVGLVMAGHIHRTIMAQVRGLPMATLKSTCHQMPLMLGAEGSGHAVDEPGAYGILRVGTDGAMVLHTEDVLVNDSVYHTDDGSL